MKHKILFLTQHTEIGGGETSLINLAHYLKKHGSTPIVLLPALGQVSKRLKKLHIAVRSTPLSGYTSSLLFLHGTSLASFRQLYQYTKKYKPHIIHANNLNLSLYAGIVGRLLDIPVVGTAHGTWDSIYFFHDLINHFSCQKILSISPEVTRHLRRRHIIPREKIVTIPLGIDTQVFIPSTNKVIVKRIFHLDPKKIIITMACRFDITKDHLTFLKIAHQILKKNAQVHFVIAGDWKKILIKIL